MSVWYAKTEKPFDKGDVYLAGMNNNADILDSVVRGNSLPTGLQVVGDYTNPTDGDVYFSENGEVLLKRIGGSEFSVLETYRPTPYGEIVNINLPEYRTADEGIDNAGNIISVGGWELSRIPVSENTEYSFIHSDGAYNPNDVGAMGFHNSVGGQISYVDMDTFSISDNGQGKKFTTPTGTAFVYVNNKVLGRDYSNDLFVIGSSAEVGGVLPIVRKKYIDKNILLLGDSITADPTWWTKYLLDIVEFKDFTNLALSGATWSHTSGTAYNDNPAGGVISDDNVIWNQINKHITGSYEVPDVVYILAGTNDYDRAVGTPSTVFNNSAQTPSPSDKLDVSSAFRFCVDLLYATYPECKVIVATPITRAGNDTNTKDRSDVIKECASLCGCEVYDQFTESGFSAYSEGLTHTKISADNIHPTVPLGASILGEYNANKLLSSFGWVL